MTVSKHDIRQRNENKTIDVTTQNFTVPECQENNIHKIERK